MKKRTALLSLLVFSLMLAIVGIGYFLNRRSSSGVSTVLTVQVKPFGSKVYIDGDFVGQTPLTKVVQPGDYQLLIQNEHYISWDTDVSIFLNENIVIERTLVFQPYTERIATDVRQVFWDTGDRLFFLTGDGGTHLGQFLSSGESEFMGWLPGDVDQVAFRPDGGAILYLSRTQLFPSLFSMILESGEVVVLQDSGALLSIWSPAGDEYYFFGNPEPGGENAAYEWALFKGNLNGSVSVVDLPRVSQIQFPTGFGFSADGEWLHVMDDQALYLWRRQGAGYMFEEKFEDIRYAEWSPTGVEDRLLLLNGLFEPLVLSPESGNTVSLDISGQSWVGWHPDGEHIVYSVFRPAELGTALWQISFKTDTKTLLADPSNIRDQLISFRFSSTGGQLVYLNARGDMVLLFLAGSE